jgi:hypothetical protein
VLAAEHVRCRRFDDDIVLVDLHRGEYFALDAVGARMWELLVAGETPASVAAALAGEYDATETEILHDCLRLTEELLGRGLVVGRP